VSESVTLYGLSGQSRSRLVEVMFQNNKHNWIQRTLAPQPPVLDALRNNEWAVAAITDSTIVSLIVSGKADDKRIDKAVLENFRNLTRPRELPSFCRSLAETLNQPGTFEPCVGEHLRRCAQVGLDLTAREDTRLPDDPWDLRELTDEGLFLDYATPVDVRRSLRTAVDALRPVIEKEDSLSPDILLARKQPHDRAEKFMLAAVLGIRRAVCAMIFEGLDQPVVMVQGPSVFAARVVVVSLCAELFAHYPRPAVEQILKRCNTLLTNFRCDAHYISKRNGWISPHLKEAKRASNVTGSVLEWISQSHALRDNLAALEALPISGHEDECLLAVLHAPPAFDFLFSAPVQGALKLYAHTSVLDAHAKIKVSGDPLFEAVGTKTEYPPVEWHMDANGVPRFSISAGFVPICESDLGLDQESFDALAARLRKLTAGRLEQMCALWSEVPRLYTEKPSDPSCVVHVFKDEDLLIFRVTDPDAPRISEILKADQSSKPSERQDLDAGEAPASDPDTSTVSESQTAKEDVRLIHETHRQVGRPTFRDFFRTLRALGVTIEPGGEGSHQKLIKDGYHSTVSKNVRDNTLVLAPWMVHLILNDLRLSVAEYAAALTKVGS
jgi:hypothetical protein